MHHLHMKPGHVTAGGGGGGGSDGRRTESPASQPSPTGSIGSKEKVSLQLSILTILSSQSSFLSAPFSILNSQISILNSWFSILNSQSSNISL